MINKTQTFHKTIKNKRLVSYSHKIKNRHREVIDNEQKRSAIYGTENPHTVHGKDSLGA